jgi:hypothetical protein
MGKSKKIVRNKKRLKTKRKGGWIWPFKRNKKTQKKPMTMEEYRKLFVTCQGRTVRGRFLQTFYKDSCAEMLLDEETANELKKCLLNALIRYLAAAFDPLILPRKGGDGSLDPMAKAPQIGPDPFNNPNYIDPFTAVTNTEPIFVGEPSSSKKKYTSVAPSGLASVSKRKLYRISYPSSGNYTIDPLDIAKLHHTVIDEIFEQIAQEFLILTTLSGQFVCAKDGSHYARYAIDALVPKNKRCKRDNSNGILQPSVAYVKDDRMIYRSIVRDLLTLYTSRLTPDGNEPVHLKLLNTPAVVEFILPLLGHVDCPMDNIICMYFKLFQNLHVGNNNIPSLH